MTDRSAAARAGARADPGEARITDAATSGPAPVTPGAGAPLRVVGVADTDSYVKWTAALLGGLDGRWQARMLVLQTPLVVSDAQLAAALAGSGLGTPRVERVVFDDLASRLAEADVVVVGARGPLVRVVARLAAALPHRPAIVTGLPGISIPATRKALLYRTQSDLFVVHSARERREFAALATERGLGHRFALATLPFASAGTAVDEPSGGDLVFAAQAKVPAERRDRMRVARLLVAAAEADPTRRVVLKLRAARGEHQTHAERDGYDDLIEALGPRPANLVVSTASMGAALRTAQGVVTVSSTAAVEAIARGVPVIALDTFGVSPELINVVFEGSGLFGDERAVVERRFRHPAGAWLHDNYFHDAEADDTAPQLLALGLARRAGRLAALPPLTRRGGAFRDAWDRKVALGPYDRSFAGAAAMVVGVPTRAVVRVLARVRRIAAPAAVEGAAATSAAA